MAISPAATSYAQTESVDPRISDALDPEADLLSAFFPASKDLCTKESASQGGETGFTPRSPEHFGVARTSSQAQANYAQSLQWPWAKKDPEPSGVKINGVDIPKEFTGGNIVDNISFSADYKKYAEVTAKGELKTGSVPKDGNLKLSDGSTMHVGPSQSQSVVSVNRPNSQGGVSVSQSVVIKGNVTSTGNSRTSIGNIAVASGNSVAIVSGNGSRIISGNGSSVSNNVIVGSGNVIGGGVNLSTSNSGGTTVIVRTGVAAATIDKTYNDVNAVSSRSTAGAVTLNVASGSQARIHGDAETQPALQGGTLKISEFEGTLDIPKGAKIDLYSVSGDIDGKVANPGSIRTISGEIQIELSAPMNIKAESAAGEVKAIGMVQQEDGGFTPPTGQAAGTLNLSTTSGDITVRYKPK